MRQSGLAVTIHIHHITPFVFFYCVPFKLVDPGVICDIIILHQLAGHSDSPHKNSLGPNYRSTAKTQQCPCPDHPRHRLQGRIYVQSHLLLRTITTRMPMMGSTIETRWWKPMKRTMIWIRLIHSLSTRLIDYGQPKPLIRSLPSLYARKLQRREGRRGDCFRA